MDAAPDRLGDLPGKEKVVHLLDMMQRILVHYALWFSEVRKNKGDEQAMEILQAVTRKSFGIQMKRMAQTFGIEMKDGIPTALLDLPEDRMELLIRNTAVNWLANDGVWFQGVEFSSTMQDAKACNDACWHHFSPHEARSIKALLGIPDQAGLEGLKKALNFRLYAIINTQSITQETDDSFVFQMNECRVQAARKRKNLDDYPCKSAGIIEYTRFAQAIDSRIRTECIGCPPDPHPDAWYCAWRFTLK